jgi:hypothetical protein
MASLSLKLKSRSESKRPSTSSMSRGETPEIGSKRLLKAGAILSLSFYFTIAAGINRGDEAWFLQVASRVARGEVLYRDIFYGAGPLAVYATLPFIRVIGVEVVAVKLVVAISYTLSLLFGLRILRYLKARRRARLSFIGLNLLLAPPSAVTPYQTLANAFLMATFATTVEAYPISEKPGRFYKVAALIGIWSGLCFVTKQNIGVYGFAAAWTSLALSCFLIADVRPSGNPTALSIEREDGAHIRAGRSRALDCRSARRDISRPTFLRAFGPSLILLALTTALALVPTLLSGGWSKFLEYGFINKTTYLRTGVPYASELLQAIGAVRSPHPPGPSFQSPRLALEMIFRAVQLSSFLLPLLIVPIWPLGWRRSDRRYWVVFGCFMAAALAGLYPRADYRHMLNAVPALLVGTVWAWEGWTGPRSAWRHKFDNLIASAVAASLSLAIALPLFQLVKGYRVLSQLPHFRGPLIEPALQAHLQWETAFLRRLGTGERLLLLTPHAGFFYLTTGLRNLTPYDYPLVTAFGLHGEEMIIEAIERGDIEVVCAQLQIDEMRAAKIEDYVVRNLEPVARFEEFTIYRRPRAMR